MNKKIEEDNSINVNEEMDKRINEGINNYLSSLSVEEAEKMSRERIDAYNKSLSNKKYQ